MRKFRTNRKGFTLIELVLVIAILGILAVVALPNIFNVSLTSARQNSRDAVAAAVQTGLSLYAASQLALPDPPDPITYPADLGDTAGVASRTNPLFSGVLQGGVTRDWTKVSATCYTFTGGGATDAYVYTAGTTGTFAYAAAGCPE